MAILKTILFLSLLFSQFSVSPAGYPIKHVITLMMENRSFDHFLGRLNRLMPTVNGLNGTEQNPESVSNPNSKEVPVNENAEDGGPFDPCHSFDCITEQCYGTSKPSSSAPIVMNGFVQNAHEQSGGDENFVMSGFNSTTLPVLTTLAQEFAVFDSWFCSCPCPTNPNREYMMSGTSAGLIDNNVPASGLNQQTHFLYLQGHGHTWKIYYHDDIWGAAWFNDLRTPQSVALVQEIDYLWSDIAAGTLPEYSLIQPRMSTSATGPSNWQHPDNSVSEGEVLYKKVYETLRSSSYWNDTLLIITFDEHGGFYDHVPTPTGTPNPDGIKASNGFNFDRLGVRIPTVVVSPWIAKGTVVHQPTGVQAPQVGSQFESTSIITTTNNILGVPGTMSARQAWAGSFDNLLLELSSPRTDCPVTLPAVNPLTPEQLEFEMNLPLNEHHVDNINLMCELTRSRPHAACEFRGALKLKQRDYSAVMSELTSTYKELVNSGIITPTHF